MKVIIKNDDSYAKLVNFQNNKNKPIHRWFNIKEGYSEELILKLLDNLSVKKGYVVDFFNGSGTTSLAAKKYGYKYGGFEINPFLFDLSQAKLSDYSKKELDEILLLKKSILNNKIVAKDIVPINLSIVEKVFKHNLKDILNTRSKILKIKKNKIKNFFLIALVSIIEDVGYAKKDGNGLKYPSNKKIFDFLDIFSDKIDLMVSDIKENKFKNKKGSFVVNCDSRDIKPQITKKIKGNTSLIVFSPPYANCFDYTEVYKLELWLSNHIKKYDDLKKIRKDSLSSHLNKDLGEYENNIFLKEDLKILRDKYLWSKKIIPMLNGYFYDMEKILEYSYKILMPGSSCVVVVGNSAYANHVIETDVILSKIAKKIGFSKVVINIARKLRSSSQQAKTLKSNNLRESVIIMTK